MAKPRSLLHQPNIYGPGLEFIFSGDSGWRIPCAQEFETTLDNIVRPPSQFLKHIFQYGYLIETGIKVFVFLRGLTF